MKMTNENNLEKNLEPEPEIRYQIGDSNLYILGGKNAKKIINNLERKKRYEEFMSLSDHLD